MKPTHSVADVTRSTIDIICVQVKTARRKLIGVRTIHAKTTQPVTEKPVCSTAAVNLVTQARFVK